MVLPAAGHGEPRLFSIIMRRPPPRFEVCGDSGMTTSRGHRQRPHLSRSPTQRRSGSVRAAHPDPSRRDHRTHAMSITAEFSGLCPQPPVKGRVNLTPRCIILTCSQLQKWRQTHIVHCSPLAVPSHFNGLAGVRLAGKRPVSTETGRKHRPTPTGELRPPEQNIKFKEYDPCP